jgi:CRISPR-associated exonuclease Cas4
VRLERYTYNGTKPEPLFQFHKGAIRTFVTFLYQNQQNHFNYYQLCHRKLWLFANGINMEQESDLVYEGKLVHESSYPQRTSKYEEAEIDGIKVDYYDARNKVIHEIKKSNKVDKAHEWQLKYYMYVFEQHGIDGVKGILEYPLLRKTKEVILTDVDRE